MFHCFLPRKLATRIELISMDTLENLFANVLFIVKYHVSEHDIPFSLEMNSNGGIKWAWETLPLKTSPLPQSLWPPNMAEWWLIMKGVQPSGLKSTYLHHHSHQTWQLGDIQWCAPTQKSHDPSITDSCEVTLQIEQVRSRLTVD